ncbi:acyltransferase 3 [Pseudofrankia inefficax]|uniref:Acyltransferase 3 n=2 Tax=Pseudofrankia inefficax (strain DSM 45817 / CECT 9037 / DDB 130130 / EuI1c) TaxID=298654 RepID=E3JBC8_PSEI1|nr:acyltransferase 3 [Pseudofrankia inefficax]
MGLGLAARPLSTAFNRSGNSLNMIRLLLAATVVISHSRTIAGHGDGISIGHGEIAKFAVDAFFVISGFLITGSRLGLPTGRYLWNRILRIFPAFWAALLGTAFLAAPIAWYHDHNSLGGLFTDAHGPVQYVLRNCLLDIGFWDVAGTPAHVPFPAVWDGSIWTLRWEVACYLGIAALGAVGLLARRGVVLGIFGVMWAAYAFHDVAPSVAGGAFAHQQTVTRFALLFLSGTLMCLFQDKIPFSDALGALALVEVAVAYVALDHAYIWAGPPLAYACLWVATRVPMPKLLRNDFSYGLYIFTMPVQQLLAVFGLAKGSLTVYTVLSLSGGLALAALSWFGLEKRVLKLKNFTPGFLKDKGAAAGAHRRLRRPPGMRASTMVIPMPEEIRSAMTGSGRAEPSRRGASRPAQAPAPAQAESGRSRSRRRSGSDRPVPPAPPPPPGRVDETMLLLPASGVEETMRLPPQPSVDDTVRLRRGRQR